MTWLDIIIMIIINNNNCRNGFLPAKKKLFAGFVCALYVLGEISFLIAFVTAFIAFEIKRFRVCHQMLRKIVAHSEPALANLAKVVLFFCMHRHVYFQFRHRSEFTIAHLTHTVEYVLVDFLVHIECGVGTELLGALVTLKNALFQVNAAYVVRNDALATKVISTYVALVLFYFLVEMIYVVFIAS